MPWPLGIAAAVGATFLLLPLLALVVRTPWHDLGSILSGPDVGRALRLSLITSTAATVLSIVLGVPLAWVLARARWRGVQVLRAMITLPLVLPPVVGGIALLFALGRHGLIGEWLDRWFGVTIPFTTFAVVLAEAFVAMPFLIITVEGALRSDERGYDEAAATLGATAWQRFRWVTIPLLRPALMAGSVLCWARALGEFGATITFAGSFPGTTQTMPIAAYLAMQTDPRSATGIAVILLAISLVVLVAMRGRWWTRAGSDG